MDRYLLINWDSRREFSHCLVRFRGPSVGAGFQTGPFGFGFESEDFGGGDSDVFSGCDALLIRRRRDERAPCQVVRFPKESAGALMNGRDGGFLEKIPVRTGDFEMMPEVLFHFPSVDAFQMASGHDS